MLILSNRKMTPDSILTVDNRAMLKCLRNYCPYILSSTTSPIPSMLPHYTHSPSSTDAFQLCLSPFQLLPKLTGKPQHSRLRRIFKGQRLLHVYDVSPEESRQGESGGTKPLRNFTQFWTRWEGDMKACLGRLFLVNMGPSK